MNSPPKIDPVRPARETGDTLVLPEALFRKWLDLEKRRLERSSHKLILLLIELPASLSAKISQKILGTLCHASRETDIKGWYRENSTFGIIFTEIAPQADRALGTLLTEKILAALAAILEAEQMAEVRLAWFMLPDDGNLEDAPALKAMFNPKGSDRRKVQKMAKRTMDIAGSMIAILLAAPLFAAIALAIRLTSAGPILFCQERLGQNGRRFTFLKFRSMYERNDPAIHEEYVKRLIAGDPDLGASKTVRNRVFKITNDPRVTRIGRFLRRTSLDELPQFVNVLRGEMSLVGPRPPVPYEAERYALWHRRRLEAAKPGITGLWQVHGRSTTTFDEMVRLDLRYGRSWSIWLDLKILFQTPWAVLRGVGAY